MAGETKSDNKLFQMVMVIITTIVAPVSVYFITHAIDVPKDAPAAATSTISNPIAGVSITSTLDLPLLTATVELPVTMTTVPTNTPDPQPTKTLEPTPTQTQPQPTITLEPSATLPAVQSPQGVLPAGDPVNVNGIAVSVVSKEVQRKDDTLTIQIHVRNLTEQKQTFTYSVQSIVVEDANGQALELINGEKRSACSKKDLSAERKIELAPNQEILLRSIKPSEDMNWCASKNVLTLPLYKATSKEVPVALLIKFNDFGPFYGFGFKVDLP